MIEPLSHHAALIYVMVTISAVDRTMSDDELARDRLQSASVRRLR
jgi:hypothetical protein